MAERMKRAITTTATVVAITAGGPSTLTIVKRAVNLQGIARLADLSAPDYTASLVDFVKAAEDVSAAAPVRELAAQFA